MKNIILTAVVIGITATSCIKDLICINGNGNVETQSRNTTSFNSAVNTTSVDIIYLKADSISISVMAESNIINHIVTITKNDRLEIRTDPRNACFDYRHRPVVTITSPELSTMELTGSGDFSADTLSGNSVTVRLTGSGNLLANVINSDDLDITLTGSGDADIAKATCQDADFSLTGSGDLTIAGNGENGIMRVTGSGDIRSDGFQLMTATETITGSGNINTLVQNSLKAVISGSGNIFVRGNPDIDQTTTGSGRVIRR